MMKHSHGHHHDKGHIDGNCHGHVPEITRNNARVVGWAALVTGFFMLIEAVGGYLSGSLALIADAGHMLTDFAALALAWLAFHLARNGAGAHWPKHAALINGLTLFPIAAWILWEAWHRLTEGHEGILGGMMLGVAVVGLIVNLVVLRVLGHGDKDNLNIRAASLHVMGDLLGSVAAIVAALIILATGWTPIDPILSALVAVLILFGAVRVVKAAL